MNFQSFCLCLLGVWMVDVSHNTWPALKSLVRNLKVIGGQSKRHGSLHLSNPVFCHSHKGIVPGILTRNTAWIPLSHWCYWSLERRFHSSEMEECQKHSGGPVVASFCALPWTLRSGAPATVWPLLLHWSAYCGRAEPYFRLFAFTTRVESTKPLPQPEGKDLAMLSLSFVQMKHCPLIIPWFDLSIQKHLLMLYSRGMLRFWERATGRSQS